VCATLNFVAATDGKHFPEIISRSQQDAANHHSRQWFTGVMKHKHHKMGLARGAEHEPP
jgi:hypothetical protein